MANIIKALGAGTITVTGTADLYTVPANKSAIVYSVRLVNVTAATTDPMNLYAKPSGLTARRIAKKDFTLAATALFLAEDVVTLGQGDKIQLNINGNQSPSLGYMLNGLERD